MDNDSINGRFVSSDDVIKPLIDLNPDYSTLLEPIKSPVEATEEATEAINQIIAALNAEREERIKADEENRKISDQQFKSNRIWVIATFIVAVLTLIATVF